MTTNNLPRRPKSVQPCSVGGCESTTVKRGFCGKHYRRVQRYGDPAITKYRHPEGSTSLEKFWFFVDTNGDANGCWPWGGTLDHYGYGQATFEGQRWRAHVLSWTIANGRRPTLNILHSCDNPPCVNPAHLREGTQKENVADAIKRGRKNPHRKLSDADREEIWRMLREGVTLYRIAKNFRVSHAAIQYIRDLPHAIVP